MAGIRIKGHVKTDTKPQGRRPQEDEDRDWGGASTWRATPESPAAPRTWERQEGPSPRACRDSLVSAQAFLLSWATKFVVISYSTPGTLTYHLPEVAQRPQSDRSASSGARPLNHHLWSLGHTAVRKLGRAPGQHLPRCKHSTNGNY